MKDFYPKQQKKPFAFLSPLSRPICSSLNFLLCCKLKASKEIDLMLKMVYDVHSLRLPLVFGWLLIGNKVKYRINSKVQINASLNSRVSLFRPIVTRIVGTLYK